MELHFATGNPHKVEEASRILDDVTVEQLDAEVIEPQEVSLAEVARFKVEQALQQSQLLESYIMADDSGLFIDALDGFPGILSSPFYHQVGKERLLDLVDEGERTARFRAAIALYVPDTGKIEVFEGNCEGKLVKPRGDGGFGYDPMFLPEDHEQTFAEDPEHKQTISHRRRALETLRDWLQE